MRRSFAESRPADTAVAWKRAKLAGRKFAHLPTTAERIERAIDADVEWLEAHPSRKSIAASRQAKKTGKNEK